MSHLYPFFSPGHYLFTDASPPRLNGDVARLISVVIPPTSRSTCFRFQYHMRGTDVGSLSFYVRYGQTTVPLWTLSGFQGNSWLSGRFPLPRQTRVENSQVRQTLDKILVIVFTVRQEITFFVRRLDSQLKESKVVTYSSFKKTN